MPELPEVETIVRDLHECILGLKLVDFKLLNPLKSQLRPQINLPEKQFRDRLNNRKIIKISRRAKTLVFDLGQDVLLIHLKMTGQLVFERCKGKECELVVGGHPIANADQDLPNKFTRAFFSLNDGSRLYFNDVRRFGWLKLETKKAWELESDEMGLEPFDKAFSVEFLAGMLRRKPRTTIKQAILEQKYVVGVGNIYADEALFKAKIKPTRPANSLSDQEISGLHRAIIDILRLSIKHRGTSFSDYRDANGIKGNFLSYLAVYGRAKLPCKVCGRPISKARVGGRGTHWCDNCQS